MSMIKRYIETLRAPELSVETAEQLARRKMSLCFHEPEIWRRFLFSSLVDEYLSDPDHFRVEWSEFMNPYATKEN